MISGHVHLKTRLEVAADQHSITLSLRGAACQSVLAKWHVSQGSGVPILPPCQKLTVWLKNDTNDAEDARMYNLEHGSGIWRLKSTTSPGSSQRGHK